ncbi:BBE domain-containing protein, partial [Streptomyces sp. CB02056]|uniref:BBE domain-containing protein n=1 Tax=Streptomyces sp. CB02056 TaxID=1703924 RepID=UPI001F5231E1
MAARSSPPPASTSPSSADGSTPCPRTPPPCPTGTACSASSTRPCGASRSRPNATWPGCAASTRSCTPTPAACRCRTRPTAAPTSTTRTRTSPTPAGTPRACRGAPLYYRDNHRRLQRVKERWDPLDLFAAISSSPEPCGNVVFRTRRKDSCARRPPRGRLSAMTAAAVVLGAFAALPPAAPANAAAGCGPVPAALPPGPGAPRPESSAWTGSWGTAMSLAGPPAASGVTGRQTLRMVVHTSIGGSSARIHLVNTFSPDPVTIGHVTVAAQDRTSARNGNPATAAATPVTLTF